MPTAEATVVSLNLTDPAAVQDPAPKLAEIRDAGPVLYDPEIAHYIVSGYDDCRAGMSRAADFAQDVEFFEKLQGGRAIAAMDNPDHMAIRGIFNPSFTRDGVSSLRPFIGDLIERRLAAALARMRDGEAVDFVAEVTGPLAIETIAHMLGVPAADTSLFTAWADDMLKITEATSEPDPQRRDAIEAEGLRATASLNEYAGKQLADRRERATEDDLVGLFAHSEVAVELLSDIDQRANVTLFVVAGHDSSMKMLGHLLVTLAQYPDQRRALAEDRSLIPQAIEELLRWAVMAPFGPKVARRDVTIGDTPVPEGAKIFNILAAGNRDPRRWENPDSFDIFREQKAHIAFGFGTHTCMGANLMRLELTMMIEALLDRMPEYELAEDVVRYGPMFMKRGPIELRIAL